MTPIVVPDIVRPALGAEVPIGTIYDATRDQFLPASGLPPTPPAGVILASPCPIERQNEITTSIGSSHAARFAAMGIDPNLAASVLSGLINPQGSGTFLTDGTSEKDILYGAVRHIYNTCQERLNLSPDLLDMLAYNTASMADHHGAYIVVGVTYGLQSIITMKHHIKGSSNKEHVESIFQHDLQAVYEIAKARHSYEFSDNTVNKRLTLEYELKLYTDVQREYGINKQSLALLFTFLQKGPQQIRAGDGGKGYPITYSMLPVQQLKGLLPGAQVLPSFTPKHVTDIDPMIDIVDRFNEGKDKLEDYKLFIQGNKQHIPYTHVEDVDDAIFQISEALERFKHALQRAVIGVRAGTMDGHCLHEIYAHVGSHPEQVSMIAGQQSDKINFIKEATDHGATYIGFNGLSTKHRDLPHDGPVPYAFEISNAAMKISSSWDEKRLAFMEFLLKPSRSCQVYIIDCDAPSEYKHLDGALFGKWERNIEAPSPRLERNRSKMERDEPAIQPEPQIHSYQCEEDTRGHSFTFNRNTSSYPHEVLTRSDRPVYYNILVLGETGVGKSTFINALYNYLKFETFDEAKMRSAKKLEYVVPCHFEFNAPSPSDPYDYVRKVIRVGHSDRERNGIPGNSATQQTSVYEMPYKGITYRIFDTPGIGDTRGPEQDKENVRGIMALLRNYEELHGILILLRSSETRLTERFEFCFQELLTYLSREAVLNIAFGFTHTMGSGYRPGDCYPILKRKLQDLKVNFDLGSQTAYSFDADSFRYLAALYRKVEVSDDSRYCESWDRSKMEALRFLYHVGTLKPHDVAQTTSMEEARRAVEQLLVPMVQVSQGVQKNIELVADKLKELKDTRLTGDELRKKLHVDKIEFSAKKLEKPRTVCKHKECCDYKTNSDGEIVVIYNSICHQDCNLADVTEDCVGDPGLIKCRAFKRGSRNHCIHKSCGHHWQEHMHYRYELEERKARVKDTEVERLLKANTDDIEVRQAGIRKFQDLQQEYVHEQKQLRRAAVRFVVYLQRHAFTTINDATEKYYHQLIEVEESKIQFGKDKRLNVDPSIKKLKRLKRDLNAYLELNETINRDMRDPCGSSDEPLDKDGVQKLKHDLYNLKHFGHSLKKMKIDIGACQEIGLPVRSPCRAKSQERKPDRSGDGGARHSRRREGESSGSRDWR
ncbi:uncharacterized protein B0J16DRAFT_311119 [Fusarium flagelliforme]|uniref:uncharacterized protein n=1 Tax=Fusarium flagelliforme TaxID=2675880 RepID=UPI001E8CBF4C|nr:uncharacterized protein B0J16DRAFT_311119 [Fusarium flagelliforme]KAH7173325.1 hypothetical protein B0J16DRAFT_311119 [Fusarium flagelliforme]